MKKTKEIEKEENSIEKILKFESLEDAEKFAEVASGRKFCKKGERIQDICNEEIENYVCKTSGNIIFKLYWRHKIKKNRERLLLESRLTSCIRAVVMQFIDDEDDNLNVEKLTIKVKNAILDEVKKYKKQLASKEK